MNGPEPAVWLPAATGPKADPAAVRAAWTRTGRAVLIPDLDPGPGTVVLEDAGLRVLAAIEAVPGQRAVLVGSGHGAMVAMHLAAHFPARVRALVLTSANRLTDRTRRGLNDAVTAVLPLARVQTLSGRTRVLELLDRVRSRDYAPYVDRVAAPALVVVGERDVANFAASRRLAAWLPNAELTVAPEAGEGWVSGAPGLLVECATDFLARTGQD